MLSVVLIILAACGSSSEESNAESNNQPPDDSVTQKADGDASTKGSGDDENKTENAPEATDSTQMNDQEDTSDNTSDNSTTSHGDSEVTKKEDYLEKLNEMEEADRYSETGSTTTELEQQEAERYEKWDTELNEIYSVLEEQLSIDQMDQLREEQRDWVEHRDEAAKDASLEYEGGSTEALEYVATQATLTRERCYALVANYI